MAKWKDLNMIKNLAVRSIVLSIPAPLFQSIYIIVGRLFNDFTWQTDRPYVVFLFAGLVQYFAMSLRYNYWTYIFAPWMLMTKQHPSEHKHSSYELLTDNGSRHMSEDTWDEKEFIESDIERPWTCSQSQPPGAKETLQPPGGEVLQPSGRDLLRDPEKSHIRSTSYFDVSPKFEFKLPLTRSIVMADTERLCGPKWNPNIQKAKTPIQLRGVTFNWFVNWVRFNLLSKKYANTALQRMSTRDLVTDFVKPRIRKFKTKALWPHIPEDERGPPHIFVSHAWDMQLQDLIEALRDWRREYFEKKWATFYWLPRNLKLYKEPRIWLDILALPQDGSGDSAQLIQIFTQTITAIRKVVLCVDVDFKPLKRSWCLYELAMASKFDLDYHVGMSVEFSKVGKDFVNEKVRRIDVEKATARDRSDKEMIDNRIKSQFGSFEELNTIIKDIFIPRINDLKANIAGIF